MGELKKAFHVRHPGEGRDPVCKMFVEETKKLSGSRISDSVAPSAGLSETGRPSPG